ncbi:MAG TPA: DALR anticodon-binding domain-containing protein [Streptosporangiaceae bacterium]|nr:DALR anticodon-binding domain-containing protein [Streptosporangiaceae bacterium]
MIPGDIGIEIARLLDASVATGLPGSAARIAAAGTWRPAPARAGGGPGCYATSLPFALAAATKGDPATLGARLADGLRQVPWIDAARVTGGGYVTVRVSAHHLAGLPARIIAAGPDAAAASSALAGTVVTAPGPPDLSAARTWAQAWRDQRAALVGRLAREAGAEVLALDSQRTSPSDSPGPAGQGPVAAAVTWHGADAVRWALAAAAAGRGSAIERRLDAPLDLANPFVLVRYAHADASSTIRWAADLGIARAGRGASPSPLAEPQPAELALLDALSWLPERVAAAARRGRPAELAAFLEVVASAWLDCREACPALSFGGQAAPADPGGPQAAARLDLAAAAGITLAAGMALLGLAAPARM